MQAGNLQYPPLEFDRQSAKPACGDIGGLSNLEIGTDALVEELNPRVLVTHRFSRGNARCVLLLEEAGVPVCPEGRGVVL